MTETIHLGEEGLVSIIIPLFNRAGLIETTLQSVLQQTYAKWEIVIVEDHSTDNSLEIALKWQQQEPRIRVFQRDRLPKGAPACRNIGVEKASGEFLIFLDSDDLLAPWCLEERVARFRHHMSMDFLVFQGAFFEKEIHDVTNFWNISDHRKDLDRFLSYESVWQTSAPIWKIAFLKENNLYFTETASSYQDWEFHLRALLLSDKYIKTKGVPDHFIRRDTTTERISQRIYGVEKLVDRMSLLRYLLENSSQLTENSLYKALFFKTISREIIQLQYKSQSPVKDIKWLKKSMKPDIKEAIVYFFISSSNLIVHNTFLLKVYRRVFLLFMGSFLARITYSRYSMSENEISDLQKKMSQYNVKRNYVE